VLWARTRSSSRSRGGRGRRVRNLVGRRTFYRGSVIGSYRKIVRLSRDQICYQDIIRVSNVCGLGVDAALKPSVQSIASDVWVGVGVPSQTDVSGVRVEGRTNQSDKGAGSKELPTGVRHGPKIVTIDPHGLQDGYFHTRGWILSESS
jgi:hypothetical protein